MMAKTETLLLLLLLFTSAYSMLYTRRAARLSQLWRNRYTNRPMTSPKTTGSQLLNMRHMLNNAKANWWAREQKQCQLQRVVLYYEPPVTRAMDDCKPIYVMTSGCKGACYSYSSVDPRNPTTIVHSCSCCQQLSFRTFYANMPCERGFHIRIPVKRATECSCRPCYSDDTSDVVRVRDLLTNKKSPFSFG